MTEITTSLPISFKSLAHVCFVLFFFSFDAVIVPSSGGLHILFGGKLYSNFSSLTNQSVETAGNLSISKSDDDCLEVSFPSTTSVTFCVKKEMLSFVVSPGDDYKNSTKGLLGTWNDNTSDDFNLPDGTVLSPSSTAREIHFGFGVKCEFRLMSLQLLFDKLPASAIWGTYISAGRSVLGKSVPEATGRGPYLRPRAQFFPIRTDLGRQMTCLFFLP